MSEGSNDSEADDDGRKTSTSFKSHSTDSCFSSSQVSTSDIKSSSDTSTTSVQRPVYSSKDKLLGKKRKSVDNNDSCIHLTEEDFGSTPKRHQRSLSKGFELGMFLPQSITPFSKLPDPNKWAVDVSDHILFDNLPEALGTWNKMKGIVKKVQNFMKLHTEDD